MEETQKKLGSRFLKLKLIGKKVPDGSPTYCRAAKGRSISNWTSLDFSRFQSRKWSLEVVTFSLVNQFAHHEKNLFNCILYRVRCLRLSFFYRKQAFHKKKGSRNQTQTLCLQANHWISDHHCLKWNQPMLFGSMAWRQLTKKPSERFHFDLKWTDSCRSKKSIRSWFLLFRFRNRKKTPVHRSSKRQP